MSVTLGRTFEAFSLAHASILDGTTGAEALDGDIYGINSGSIQTDVGSFDNTGDDAILSTWFWFNTANVTVQAGYIPFNMLPLVYGHSVTSSGTAPNDFYSFPLYAVDSVNQAPVSMLLGMASRDANGVSRTLEFILYKVYIQPLTFDGPSYKNGLKANFNGRAVLSNTDEKGNILDVKTVGRLINRPPVTF